MLSVFPGLSYPILPNFFITSCKKFVHQSPLKSCAFSMVVRNFTPSVPFHPARCPTSPRAVPSHPKIKGFENH